MPHSPPTFREPGSEALPYGLPLGISVQAEFKEDTGPNTNLNVDGSITPVFFGVVASPDPTAYHTFMIIIRTFTNMVFPDKFGDLPALTNGIKLAVRDPDKNVIGTSPDDSIKTNGDWFWLGPEYVHYELGFAADPGSLVAIQVRTQPSADAIALNPGFSIGFLISDDLTGLADMRAVAFGRNLHPPITRIDN